MMNPTPEQLRVLYAYPGRIQALKRLEVASGPEYLAQDESRLRALARVGLVQETGNGWDITPAGVQALARHNKRHIDWHKSSRGKL